MQTTTVIYFIRPVGCNGPVKIGATDNVVQRLSAIQSCSPLRLELYTAAPGDFPAERDVHIRFAADRLHGEWFRASDDLLTYMAGIKAGTIELSGAKRQRGLSSPAPKKVLGLFRSGIELTDAERKALVFIRIFVSKHRRNPTYEEIAAAKNLTKVEIHNAINRLVEKNLLTRSTSPANPELWYLFPVRSNDRAAA